MRETPTETTTVYVPAYPEPCSHFTVNVCIVSTGGSKTILSIVFCMCYSASMYTL